MKKLIILFLAITALAGFMGCSSGSSDSFVIPSSSSESSGSGTSLAGTTWLTDSFGQPVDKVGVYFKDDKNFYEASRQSSGFARMMLGEYCYYIHPSKSGTYTFDGKTLTFKYGSGTGNMGSGSVKIENNRLIYSGSSMIFVKQSDNPISPTPFYDED